MKPRVVLHNAISVDGRIGPFPLDLGTYYQLAQSFEEDVAIAGSDTLLAWPAPADAADDPLPAPIKNDPRPLLAIPDSRGRIKQFGFLRQAGHWRDIVVFVSESTPKRHLAFLTARRISYHVCGQKVVDPAALLDVLAKEYKARVVRVDSGGTLNGVFLRAGLVDEVSVLICPYLVGGTRPAALFRSADISSEKEALALTLQSAETMENGLLWLRYTLGPAKLAPPRRRRPGAGDAHARR